MTHLNPDATDLISQNEPCRRKIYLDQAATSCPKAPGVADAVYRYLSGSAVNVNRGTYGDAYSLEEQILDTREQLLKLFHFTSGKGKNVIFTSGVTASLNILLKGILRPGDHVLVSSMEHNAVMRPLVQLSHTGVTFDRIPCSPDGTLLLQEAENLLRPETRLLVCLHASNVCGTVMPVQEIGDFCRKHNLIFILDAAQTAGVLPLDMERLHIDALAFTGHKGLRGPRVQAVSLSEMSLPRRRNRLSAAVPEVFPIQKKFPVFFRTVSSREPRTSRESWDFTRPFLIWSRPLRARSSAVRWN